MINDLIVFINLIIRFIRQSDKFTLFNEKNYIEKRLLKQGFETVFVKKY